MIGIGFLLLIFIWGWIAFLAGRKLSEFSFFTRFTINAETGQPTGWDFPVKLGLIIFVFFLPLADEILAYSAYHKLCKNSGKYEFAPGMDEKKAFGREYYGMAEYEYISLFPVQKILSKDEPKDRGVIVELTHTRLIDSLTGQVILVGTDVKPIRSSFALSWDGSRYPWILQSCYASEDPINRLRLKRTINY